MEITQQFTLSKEFNDQDFFSLLFYLGYLTLDKTGDFELTMKIPNMVMKKVFINYFQHMIEKKNYTEKELEKAITDARSQIERYSSTRQMKRYPYDCWIMVFAKDTCIYKESMLQSK